MFRIRNTLIIAFAIAAYHLVLGAASMTFEYLLLRFEFPVLPVAILEQSIVAGIFGFVVARLLKDAAALWFVAIMLLPVTSAVMGWVNLSGEQELAVSPTLGVYAFVVSFQFLFCAAGVYIAKRATDRARHH